jgi:hypothetical protein
VDLSGQLSNFFNEISDISSLLDQYYSEPKPSDEAPGHDGKRLTRKMMSQLRRPSQGHNDTANR